METPDDTTLSKRVHDPDMPTKIDDVRHQIITHSNYRRMPPVVRWCVELSATPGTWRDDECNRWLRQIWEHLYQTQDPPFSYETGQIIIASRTSH